MDSQWKESICRVFKQEARLIFLTVKAPIGHRGQKIGYVNDMVRKIADKYFIIREKNKQNDGFHFHALLSQKRDIKPNWFRKGVHIHVNSFNSPFNGVIPESAMEADVLKYGEAILEHMPVEEIALVDSIVKERQKIQRLKCMSRKEKRLNRVVNYMEKDWTDTHSQYLDYILKI